MSLAICATDGGSRPSTLPWCRCALGAAISCVPPGSGRVLGEARPAAGCAERGADAGRGGGSRADMCAPPGRLAMRRPAGGSFRVRQLDSTVCRLQCHQIQDIYIYTKLGFYGIRGPYIPARPSICTSHTLQHHSLAHRACGGCWGAPCTVGELLCQQLHAGQLHGLGPQ
jgi:hypothetical protein